MAWKLSSCQQDNYTMTSFYSLSLLSYFRAFRAVFTWLSKVIGFGFGFTTPFGWLVYLLWFWFYDSQVKTALSGTLHLPARANLVPRIFSLSNMAAAPYWKARRSWGRGCARAKVCNHVLLCCRGKRVCVKRAIRSSDPSVSIAPLDIGAFTRNWKTLGCWFVRPQGGRSCRGLLQVWVIKVELFVPLLEQQRLTTTTGRFHTLFYLPPKGEYQIPCEQDRR